MGDTLKTLAVREKGQRFWEMGKVLRSQDRKVEMAAFAALFVAVQLVGFGGTFAIAIATTKGKTAFGATMIKVGLGLVGAGVAVAIGGSFITYALYRKKENEQNRLLSADEKNSLLETEIEADTARWQELVTALKKQQAKVREITDERGTFNGSLAHLAKTKGERFPLIKRRFERISNASRYGMIGWSFVLTLGVGLLMYGMLASKIESFAAGMFIATGTYLFGQMHASYMRQQLRDARKQPMDKDTLDAILETEKKWAERSAEVISSRISKVRERQQEAFNRKTINNTLQRN